MAPADVPTLVGPRLTLRGIRADDLQTFLGRTRDPEIIRMRGGDASTAGRRPPPLVARNWYLAARALYLVDLIIDKWIDVGRRR